MSKHIDPNHVGCTAENCVMRRIIDAASTLYRELFDSSLELQTIIHALEKHHHAGMGMTDKQWSIAFRSIVETLWETCMKVARANNAHSITMNCIKHGLVKERTSNDQPNNRN